MSAGLASGGARAAPARDGPRPARVGAGRRRPRHGGQVTHRRRAPRRGRSARRRRRAAPGGAHAAADGRPTRAPPRPRSRAPSTSPGSGGRSSTGPWSACTSRCSRTARCSPTTRSATTRPRPIPTHTFTRATVWDPATGTQTPVNVNTGYNVFCSGLAHLVDGSLFVAGGNKDAQLHGIVQTHVFNYLTNTWSLGPNMAAERWYPTVTPLRNGEMLITEGGPDMPEVRTTVGLAARAEHRLAQPAAVPVDRRRAGRPRVLLGPGPDDAVAEHDGHGRVAELRPARHDQPRLRQPHALRRRQDPRRGRRRLDQGRARDRHQRRDAGRLRDRADGERPPPVQPHRARRRQRAGHGRELLRRLAGGPQRRRVRGRALEPGHGHVDDAGRRAGHAPVPLDGAAAARRPRAVLGRRHLRHVRRGRLPGEERPGVHAAVPVQDRRLRRSSRPGRRSPARRRASPTAPGSGSTRRTRRRSARRR